MRWIPVSERLPEGGDAVSCEAWCAGVEGQPPGPCVMTYDADEEPGLRWQSREDTGCWEPGDVTHWRPRSTGAEGTAMNGLTKAAQDVLAERRRQIEHEGYDTAHDDDHTHRELAQAGAAYAAWGNGSIRQTRASALWPWWPEEFKPQDPRRNYVRAAALLLAAIERIDRAAADGVREDGNG